MRIPAGGENLPAVRKGRVYAVDASSYFSRPGPRLAVGIEILAQLLHPERFSVTGERQDATQLAAAVLCQRR